jgi:hypothetical protein
MDDEDRRILVEDVDDQDDQESRITSGDKSGRNDNLSVGFRPCEASCLSIVHLASVVAAIGWFNVFFVCLTDL